MLYIVVTDFNGFEQTRNCLLALRQSLCKEFSVVLVDHGTSDVTAESVAAEFPEVERISGSPDIWWAGATNLGIRHALALGAQRVMLLNNDCYVYPSTISTLTELADAHPDGIVAPVQRSLRSGGTTGSAVRSLFLFGFPTLMLPFRLPTADNGQSVVLVRLIEGGRGVIVPAAVFTKVGMFDEEALPHYCADHDFYLRASNIGVPLYLARNAWVAIDDTRTSIALEPDSMTFQEFLVSLKSIRSHRNIYAISVLFRKHYPIPGFYLIGVTLYYLRYLTVYCLGRVLRVLGIGRS
jgi:GT2 family glycosyltransferase